MLQKKVGGVDNYNTAELFINNLKKNKIFESMFK